MKTLHTTELQTAVGSRARTTVREIPTGAGPVREISVIADAVLTVAEARQLITDLQHAVALAEEFDAPEREDVSTEDQPKPREWHKGDAEPPADVTVLEDNDNDRITRGENGWVWTRVIGEDYAITPCSPSHAWANIDWTGIDTLSEVLADSEQVTR